MAQSSPVGQRLAGSRFPCFTVRPLSRRENYEPNLKTRCASADGRQASLLPATLPGHLYAIAEASSAVAVPLQGRVAVPRRAHRLVTAAAIRVRPYTVRKGDTLSSIAKKRGAECRRLAS